MSDDPTADFLAREKAILGEDADLFASGETPTAPAGIDAFPDLTSPVEAAPIASPTKPSGIDAFPALEDEFVGSSEVRVTGNVGLGEDPEREQFESAFPDLSSDVSSAPVAPKPVFNALEPQPYGASPYPPTAAPQPTRSILPPPAFANTLPETEEDTEPIRQWREQQVKDIEARNAAAAAKRDEMANKAEKAIDQFYEEYNKEKEKNIRENKEEEAKFVEKLNEDIAKGSTWERITDLIGLENSPASSLSCLLQRTTQIPTNTSTESKTIRPSGGSDLTRMKEILLTLRREGDKAPGAAGF
ncbi:uncharacterized protein EHS24_008156 [Apiotrichum porosum]|uniref:Clathrin light chain n=1 Tax=Apiotrichum porosum TaxID=105984 RepID=A0A427XT12_9TREE|nr:uncharacterized protein EHS24_008156 [Apiotrichum porosum]RSH81957.1 hypothetical protein EHS24_008156 [Apiotrichum porosum]